MKKIIIILFCFVFLIADAQTLKGGVSEEYIPKGFFGSWGVISKLNFSNNPKMFNCESRDVWTLSGAGSKLTLQNLESGATSEIIVKEKSLDNKTLKFTRIKTVGDAKEKTIYKETVSFVLSGKNFSGTDEFVVEKHQNGKLIEKNTGIYHVAGVKLD